jgi:hypothetical protein
MTDRFDEGKRALDGAHAPDLWAEAQRRADDGTVVPLTVAPAPSHRPRRWIAAAGVAAVALLALGSVALLADGDSPVDTGPGTKSTAGPGDDEITTYQADGACKVAVVGEPLPEPATVAPAESFVEGTVGTLVSGALNDTQTYAVQIPGEVVIDLVGERVEDVQLERGTAQLWFRNLPDASDPAVAAGGVQVRWFTGSQDACESFTVTVAGGTEDENRHAAVDLAERVRLPSQVPNEDPDPTLNPNPLADTHWRLERSSLDGKTTDGNGAVFAFTDDEMDWSDGCNQLGRAYLVAEGVLVPTGDAMSTAVGCPPSATSDAVHAVMSASRISWSVDDAGLLHLGAGTVELVLRPADLDAGEPGGPEASTSTSIGAPSAVGADLAGRWEIVDLHAEETPVPVPDGELLVEFLPDEVRWTDGCTGRAAPVSYQASSFALTSDPTHDAVSCPEDPGRDLINGLFASGIVDVFLASDRAELLTSERVMVLQRR